MKTKEGIRKDTDNRDPNLSKAGKEQKDYYHERIA